MKIRKAKKEDLKEISEIHLIETAKKPYLQKWNKYTTFKKIKELFEKGEIYIIKEVEKIIGYIAINSSIGSRGKKIYIDELWLREEYQGKGYGRVLINFIEKYSKNKGAKVIWLISDNKSKAFGFYNKLKFKPHFEDVLMVKELK